MRKSPTCGENQHLVHSAELSGHELRLQSDCATTTNANGQAIAVTQAIDCDRRLQSHCNEALHQHSVAVVQKLFVPATASIGRLQYRPLLFFVTTCRFSRL